MALSDLDINNVILQQTNILINFSDYQLLRQLLLNQAPITSVLEPVQQLLNQQGEHDKGYWQQQFTLQALEAQQKEDIEEARKDEQERIDDKTLLGKYTRELPTAENAFLQLDSKLFMQQKIYDRVVLDLESMRADFAIVNQSIAAVISQRRALESVVHHHHHGHDTIHHSHDTIHHGHDGYHHHHSMLDIPETVIDRINWERLYYEERRLIADRERLQNLIRIKESEFDRESRSLASIRSEKQKASETCKDLKNQIETKLPKREQQRLTRQEERQFRAAARLKDTDPFKQLSARNLEALAATIAKQNQAIEIQKAGLMKRATEASYLLLRDQLEQTLLSPTALKISFSEREALKSLISTLKDYQRVEEEAKGIMVNFEDAKLKLSILQGKFRDNVRLVQENSVLRRESSADGNIKANALYLALFGTAGSIFTASMSYAYVLQPIFLLVPAAFALMAAIALTVALVYHCIQSNNDHRIEQNNKIIAQNEMNPTLDPRVSPAENLKLNIQQAEYFVQQIASQLQEKQQLMSQLLGKAQNITVTPSYGSGLYPSLYTQKPADYHDVFEPSAPPMYDPQQPPPNYGQWN